MRGLYSKPGMESGYACDTSLEVHAGLWVRRSIWMQSVGRRKLVLGNDKQGLTERKYSGTRLVGLRVDILTHTWFKSYVFTPYIISLFYGKNLATWLARAVCLSETAKLMQQVKSNKGRTVFFLCSCSCVSNADGDRGQSCPEELPSPKRGLQEGPCLAEGREGNTGSDFEEHEYECLGRFHKQPGRLRVAQVQHKVIGSWAIIKVVLDENKTLFYYPGLDIWVVLGFQ